MRNYSPGLGRRVPGDWTHVERYALRQLAPQTPDRVERVLKLPWWHNSHDQGAEGACVGFGTSMMTAILNTEERRQDKTRPYTVRYDPWWLWDRAKEIDEWDDTNPGDSNGTSVRAACQVLKDKGHVRYSIVRNQLERLSFTKPPEPAEGISEYRWATQIDEMRACIAAGVPISIGVNWYENFDEPVEVPSPGNIRKEFWIGTDDHGLPHANIGQVRGGHCVCIYGASDRRQAFRVKNSWGRGYPLVWLPYPVMARLLQEQGEACVITDKRYETKSEAKPKGCLFF